MVLAICTEGLWFDLTVWWGPACQLEGELQGPGNLRRGQGRILQIVE